MADESETSQCCDAAETRGQMRSSVSEAAMNSAAALISDERKTMRPSRTAGGRPAR